MIYLTLSELLHVAARALGREPAVRDYGLLESALARPQATAFGSDAYRGLDAKAAALLHSLARNHALDTSHLASSLRPEECARSGSAERTRSAAIEDVHLKRGDA